MYIRALGLLLFLPRVLLAQEPTAILPNANMTPGDTFDVTAQDICAHGYARKVRDVPAEMKREVYREYGIISHGPGDYEIDHLIPLELGGPIRSKISGRSLIEPRLGMLPRLKRRLESVSCKRASSSGSH